MIDYNDLIIIDVEASGKYPIEVGISVSENTNESRLIRRDPDWIGEWDWWAEKKVHKISRDTLAKTGQDVRTVAMWLNRTLQGKIVTSDCGKSDRTWIEELFRVSNLQMKFVIQDVLVMVEKKDRPFFERKFKHFKNSYYDSSKRHRAGYDAQVIRSALIDTLELIEFVKDEQFDRNKRLVIEV